MNKQMVPLDLVLGILKDDKAAYKRIDDAFPIDPPRESVIGAKKVTEIGSIVVDMPYGTSHRLHDALGRALRLIDNDDVQLSRSARRDRDEERDVLWTLQQRLAQALGLLKDG